MEERESQLNREERGKGSPGNTGQRDAAGRMSVWVSRWHAGLLGGGGFKDRRSKRRSPERVSLNTDLPAIINESHKNTVSGCCVPDDAHLKEVTVACPKERRVQLGLKGLK